jgi:hypothetical protein
MKRKTKARKVMRQKMKIRSDTDIYQTKTLRKFGQIGKHVHVRKPIMRHVVIR